MPNRRHVLATSVSLFGGLSGCSGVLNDATTFEATSGSVPEDVLEETSYEEKKVEKYEIERTFEVEGQSQTVTVVNWQSEYDKSVALPTGERVRGAVFTVLSTPQVNVLDKEFNPVGEMSTKELAQRVQESYSGVSGLQSTGEETLTILETETSVGTFEGQANVGETGLKVDFVLRLSEAVKHEGDFVIGAAFYPKSLESNEAENATTLLTSTEH